MQNCSHFTYLFLFTFLKFSLHDHLEWISVASNTIGLSSTVLQKSTDWCDRIQLMFLFHSEGTLSRIKCKDWIDKVWLDRIRLDSKPPEDLKYPVRWPQRDHQAKYLLDPDHLIRHLVHVHVRTLALELNLEDNDCNHNDLFVLRLLVSEACFQLYNDLEKILGNKYRKLSITWIFWY